MSNNIKDFRDLTTEERQTILNRFFPNGYVHKDTVYENIESIYLGYTPDGDIVELRFWLGSNIDFRFKRPRSRKKYECIDELVNFALANTNKHKERELFDFDDHTVYFIVENRKGFTMCFKEKENKKTA